MNAVHLQRQCVPLRLRIHGKKWKRTASDCYFSENRQNLLCSTEDMYINMVAVGETSAENALLSGHLLQQYRRGVIIHHQCFLLVCLIV